MDTENVMSEEARSSRGESESADPLIEKRERLIEKRERWIRRIGYVVLFGAALAVFVPMVVAAIQGVRHHQVWDPFTGQPVMEELDCIEEAGDLIYLAGERAEPDGMWEQRYHRWSLRCQDEHQDLYHVLVLTRERMRGAEEPPQMDVIDEHQRDGG